MAELQQLSEFIVQNSNPERTIKCTPEGISLERFADICHLPGAPEEVQRLLQPVVAALRSPPLADGKTDDSSTQLESILSALVANAGRFVTLDQYAWLARATVAAELLQFSVGHEPSVLVQRLFSSLEEIELAAYSYSPSVIRLVSKTLAKDIALQGINLLHVIKKLAISNSRILYYVAVSLVFVGLEAITGCSGGAPQYRLYTVDEFLGQLAVLNMEQLHCQRLNLQIIYQLLKLLSLYENLVLAPNAGKPEAKLLADHSCYAHCFRVSDQQRKTFQLWLEKSSALVHRVGNDRDVDYLILADLIQVDMLPLLDDVNQAEGWL